MTRTRKPTARDVRMLVDVRDRLLGWLRDPATGLLPPGVRRLRSTREPFVPVDCKHGVAWTECTTCSKRGGA